MAKTNKCARHVKVLWRKGINKSFISTKCIRCQFYSTMYGIIVKKVRRVGANGYGRVKGERDLRARDD